MSDNILTTRRSMFCYSTDGVQFSGKFETREDACIEAQHQEGDCRVSTAAFDALLAYELNCMRYDKVGRPTLLPAGEGISDFAEMYGTTRAEMQKRWDDVEMCLRARRQFDGLLGYANPYQYRPTA